MIEFWTNLLLPIFSIVIPVFATVYTVNNRIKNQNRENHQPYLVLSKVEDLKELDIYSYYLTIIGRNYKKELGSIDIEQIKQMDNEYDVAVNLVIKNIGYGVATNIKFYNLLTSEQISGTQSSNKEKNQKLFTTFDIASGNETGMQSRIISLVKEVDGIKEPDHNRILCVYKDLNENIYSFIITINIKDNGHYDFFAYQQSSLSYRKWVKENKKYYNDILKKYNN